jgi:hypothetical protein
MSFATGHCCQFLLQGCAQGYTPLQEPSSIISSHIFIIAGASIIVHADVFVTSSSAPVYCPAYTVSSHLVINAGQEANHRQSFHIIQHLPQAVCGKWSLQVAA